MNFTEQLNEVGIVLNDTQRSQFDKYFEILMEWFYESDRHYGI